MKIFQLVVVSALLLWWGFFLYFYLINPSQVKAFQGEKLLGELGKWNGDTKITKLEIVPATCLCPKENCACECDCLYEGCDRICNCTVIGPKKTELNKPAEKMWIWPKEEKDENIPIMDCGDGKC